MKPIIAATNFSPISLNAVNYAADMAAELNVKLLVLHVVEVPVSSIEGSVTETGFDETASDVRKKLVLLRRQLLERTAHKIPISVNVRIGFLQQEFIAMCNLYKPFVFIIGTEERSVTERLFIASSAITAMQTLQCPVLFVPPAVRFKSIKRIGFACDLENVYELPVKFLRELVHLFNASLDIIHVSKNKNDEARSSVAASMVQKHLAEFNPSFHFIINNDVEKGITKFANENKKDLVLVIHKKRGFLDALLHRSQSKGISRRVHLPTINIPPERNLEMS